MENQLELDLVSPFLGDPPAIVPLKREQNDSPAQDEAWRIAASARLQHLQLVDGGQPVTVNEFSEFRVLIGEQDWTRSKKIWRRRARKNPLRFRKVIIAMKAYRSLF